ncbi:MAG: hypothetical protein IKH57_24770, partial [Clostridia bacterium]|nr:hypothetical protein [Clostridia bacterium]
MMIGNHTFKKAVSLFIAAFMLCTCCMGVFSGIVNAESVHEKDAGTVLYAFRSWSEIAEEQRDFVTFSTNDLENVTSLWPYSAGMMAAEYYDGTLYVVDENLGFSAVNVDDGTAQSIRSLDVLVNDMTYDYTSGNMLFLTFSYAVNAKQIGRIDLETGETTVLGTFPANINMTTISAGRESGVLYGVDGSGAVYSFDVYGNCTQIADTGFTTVYGSSSTYCYADDKLYWEHNPGQDIVCIDPATGD